MRLIGFSTGALAFGDFRLALTILGKKRITAVELSALRENELAPLVDALDCLDLSNFGYVSFHAPSKYEPAHEKEIVALLGQISKRRWPIILHPDTIHDLSAWRGFAGRLFIENMDKRNLAGRTARELSAIFQELPEARLCFDLGHARQVDPTMNESVLILQQFGTRLGQLHVSEVNSRSTHDALSNASIGAFEKIASLIPNEVPVILESPVSAEDVASEIHRARLALPATVATRATRTRETRRFQSATI